MGSSTSTPAICATRSFIVGIPNGLCFPSGLGIHTRRPAEGTYDLPFSSCWSSPSHRSSPYSSMSSNLWPSTPALPLVPARFSNRRRAPARPSDTLCHTRRRIGSLAIPSLWHAASSATSELFLEVLGSSPISSCPLLCHSLLFQPRSLPSAVITRFDGTTDLSAIPGDPAPALASRRLRIMGILIAGTSRVHAGFLACMPSPPPRRNRQTLVIHRLGFRLCDPTAAAFPMMSLGRLPHQSFRGLNGVHCCYGLHACRAA